MAASILPQRCPYCLDDSREFRAPKGHNRLIDITDQPFDRLTAMHFLGVGKDRQAYWCCTCVCGGHAIVRTSALREENSRSCGCLAKETNSALHKTHGMSHSPEHNSWSEMIRRCTDIRTDYYHNYGGRGITVCPEWMMSFERFYADMGPRPPSTSLERQNNDGSYSPENCRWATQIEQCNNTRKNRFITWNDETMTIAQWSRKAGIRYGRLLLRLKEGWDIGEALTLPPQTRAHSKDRRKQSREREVLAYG